MLPVKQILLLQKMLPRVANEETFASATMCPCLPEPYNLFISRRCQDDKAKKDRLKEKKDPAGPTHAFYILVHFFAPQN